MPFHTNEALPGEMVAWYQFDRISDRRNRAFAAVQNKLNPKHRWLISPWREILPRDASLKQVLFPQSVLVSFGLKAGDVFVDEGCFEGLFTLPAARIVGVTGKVYGIEISAKAIEKIRVEAEKEELSNITLVNKFPEKAVLEPGSVDIVFFGAAIYEMYNPMKALTNANSMLKDSGKLVILEWNPRDSNEEPSRREKLDVPIGPPLRERLDKELIEGFVEAAGFKIEAVKEEGFYLYSVVATKPTRDNQTKERENESA
jgi:ubiquinone/menaquinone biosynthesis C-methylase UbiE